VGSTINARRMAGMNDPGWLLNNWGYIAIFAVVILGNMGLPIPEETILILAGYLVWEGQLRLPLVLVVGVVSAILGDNLGYWLGHKFGRRTVERYERWIFVTPARLDAVQRIVARYGPLAVFAARFLPGLRCLAGPVAGITGVRPLPFIVANVLGASLYVPAAVGIGYAIGLGWGEYVARWEKAAWQLEHVVLIFAVCVTLILLAWRAVRATRPR
jgi:membrane protein DedA with SNARE-associated domain